MEPRHRASPGGARPPGTQQLTSVTHGPMGWLAVGGVTASAAEHPVVVVSADGASWQAADGERAFTGPGLFTQSAAANGRGQVIVGYQKIKQVQAGRVVSVRTVAAAWWSASLTGWQRAGDGSAGALDGAGNRQMLAVTAGQAGFVAVGAHGSQPSAWTSADGRTWRQVDLPLPVGATRAVLQHVASIGRTVAAVGTAVTTTGQPVPFAASSANGGATWAESALPAPAGLTSVTALTAAGRTFTATGTYGSTPGHQNVVVWTSPNGSAWHAAEPAGQGLTGPGIQAITSLTASGNTLTGVGFSASPNASSPSSGKPRSGNRTGGRGPEHVVAAVGQAGQGGPDRGDQAGVDLGDGHAGRGPEVGPDHAERVHQHAAPDAGRGPGGPLVRVGDLPDGGDPHGVLDGARPHQRDPVLLLVQPGRPRGGQHEQFGPAGRQRTGQLAEPHVVADLQPGPHPGQRAHDRRGTRRDLFGLAVPERVEQVQLAVGGDQLTGAVVGHRGVVDPAVRGGLEHPGYQRDPGLLGRGGQPGAERPVQRLGRGEQVRAEPDLGGLGEHRQVGPLGGGLAQGVPDPPGVDLGP